MILSDWCRGDRTSVLDQTLVPVNAARKLVVSVKPADAMLPEPSLFPAIPAMADTSITASVIKLSSGFWSLF
ncbi:MAG: hypothetical protein ACK5O9_07360 [Holosporales bacterium]